MFGAALGLLAVGVVLLFLVPWVGIVAGLTGVVLLSLWLLGVGRRVKETEAA